MGVEHSLQQRSWDYAVAPNPRVTDRLPKPPPGRPQDKDLKDSPNQRGLRRQVWCLEAVLAKDEKAWNDAVDRALAYFAELRQWGHMSDGDNGRTEIFTASHRQLWYALMAGFLWATGLALAKGWRSAQQLLDAATEFWRLETAVAKRCHYVDESNGEDRVLVPGARMGDPNKPSNVNIAMDTVVDGLLGGWVRPPRTPKVGNYSAAIPLLKNAFGCGVDPRTLIGNDSDLARIPARLGWHLVGRMEPPSYYAWFDNLGFVYDGLHGAGYIDDAIVLHWTRDEAVAYGEGLTL